MRRAFRTLTMVMLLQHERGAPYAAPPVFVFIFGFVCAIPMVMLWLPETSPVTYCDVLHGRCSRQAAKGYAEVK